MEVDEEAGDEDVRDPDKHKGGGGQHQWTEMEEAREIVRLSEAVTLLVNELAL